MERTRAGENGDLFSFINHISSAANVAQIRAPSATREYFGGVVRDIAVAPLLHFFGLKIDGHRNVSDAAIGECGTDREVHYVLHMFWSHDTRIVFRHIDEEVVEFDVLLCERTDEIVILHARDREDRHVVELRIVEAIEQMDRAGPRGGDANSELAGIF